MTKHLICLTVLFVATVAMVPSAARADSSLDVIQITCSKDLDHFSLRTLQLEDRKYPDSDDEKRLESSGYYNPKELTSHPYSCVVGGQTLSISVVGYYVPDMHAGCYMNPHFSISIKRDGEELYQFPPYIEEGCVPTATHLIEISSPFSLKDCLIPDGKGQVTCDYPGK